MPPTEISLIDVKYTTMDRFASFGGNYGIFAEITGCSLLGLLSIVILTYKLLFNKAKHTRAYLHILKFPESIVSSYASTKDLVPFEVLQWGESLLPLYVYLSI